ncbi:MAG: leucine--tRNA ligase [Clostridia bacterium]
MDFISNEKKWQKKWDETQLYHFDKSHLENKKYVLEMFSYPSGAKLHAGHWYNYGPSDSYARFLRMQGYNVFQPMGFDAFGLPAENYAIKTGVHPQDSTLKNIATMEQQLRNIGAAFDWDAEIKTCMPDYYKWTQWLFLQLYKKGLAYRKEAPVNWCTSCNTVLANEQVVDGVCERCGSQVIRKNLTQWFFKITDYADELLRDLDNLDWPEKTKAMQRHWIGKSTGAELEFTCQNGEKFKVFTTRADTVCGISYVVLAPEHALVDSLTTAEQKQAVADYRANCAKISEIERLSSSREKTGVWTGSFCTNPINNQLVPIWVGDYVLGSYGTGAVMGVPAHDDRDYAFAVKNNLPITRVVASQKGKMDDDLPFCELGYLVNCGQFDGLSSADAQNIIIDFLSERDSAQFKTNFRLRDWLISRQRYWGCPIPIIHCDHCGDVPVPESDLPVKLPYDVDFTPDGQSPLLKSKEFVNTVCPICGRPAQRDADTMDTFVCSSWYFLRYADAHNDKMAFDPEIINKVLPVDKYIGGAEHACMHLLYARFFTKALRDMGYLNFGEPFLSLVHQGTILGPDGNKMSKSKGNVISPDEYINKFGSDAFRMYLMFGFSYIEGGPWNASGIDAIVKFLERVERLVAKLDGTYKAKIAKADNANGIVADGTDGAKADNASGAKALSPADKELNYARNYCIKQVTADMQIFSFNTAIARIMEFVNTLYKYDSDLGANKNFEFFGDCVDDLILLLAPIVPHTAEELNQRIGQPYSVFNRHFPLCDEKALVRDEYELAVQLNSKVRAKIVVPSDATNDAIAKIALANQTIQDALVGKTIVKTVIIPRRLVNIVVK